MSIAPASDELDQATYAFGVAASEVLGLNGWVHLDAWAELVTGRPANSLTPADWTRLALWTRETFMNRGAR